MEVALEHFVETPAGVTEAKHFKVGMVDYIIVGLEDGSLHLYNLMKNFGNSYRLPQTEKGSARSLQSPSPFDQFAESNYEHHDAIVSIETSPEFNSAQKDACLFVLTASRDGILMLWSIEQLANHDDEDMLRFDSELDMKLPLSRAKWLSGSEILVASTCGDLFLV